jgi:NAD(P)-dependent dehydrogenase (short-subunit alcohol dehydrogenase family)
MNKKVILITGASAGIGEAAACMLLKKGHIVYAAARRVDKMKALAASGAIVLKMDVCDEQSMRAGVEKIIAEQGGIDVLVNNAGYGSLGALEEVALSEARRQFEVNVFGAARLTQLVLPVMRRKGSGRIINISSVGARLYEPLSAWYHSTKFAIEGLSDCLRLELQAFGVDVVLIRPGFIRTEWDKVAHEQLQKFSSDGPYAGLAELLANAQQGFLFPYFASDANIAAKTIVRSIEARRPRTRYVCGRGARAFLLSRQLFSDRMLDRVLRLMLTTFGKPSKSESKARKTVPARRA